MLVLVPITTNTGFSDAQVTLSSSTGSIFAYGGTGVFDIGSSALTLSADQGSIGTSANGLEIETNGTLSALNLWAKNEINVTVLDANADPAGIASLSVVLTVPEAAASTSIPVSCLRI